MKTLFVSSGLHRVAHIAYCGPPPIPGTLMARWNLDPVLVAALGLALIGVLIATSKAPAWRRGAFVAGWVVAACALVSPLCALSVSLFSARVGQHMVLEMVAAPLIALGLARGDGRRIDLACVAFAAALWFWHAPAPYAWTFASPAIYWLMHVTSFGAALWLWIELVGAATTRVVAFLAVAAATTLQMGLLGALITFSARPVYAIHALTTWAWGFSPLADQQLGGVIMWVPAGVILLAAFMVAVAGAMRPSSAEQLASA